ncbi:hypothetical protein SBV1_2010034 [Verrucomicrobia bacterium]|nr:hypothetical protein SBV1_2010034 [Verrucomicrobiota bacterium]
MESPASAGDLQVFQACRSRAERVAGWERSGGSSVGLLLLNGRRLPVAQMGPDFLLLEKPADYPAGTAQVLLNVDGHEERWAVRLPLGIQPGDKKQKPWKHACTLDTDGPFPLKILSSVRLIIRVKVPARAFSEEAVLRHGGVGNFGANTVGHFVHPHSFTRHADRTGTSPGNPPRIGRNQRSLNVQEETIRSAADRSALVRATGALAQRPGSVPV